MSDEQQEDPGCASCRFFYKITEAFGQCRRLAPRPHVWLDVWDQQFAVDADGTGAQRRFHVEAATTQFGNVSWPCVQTPEDWCGEHESKVKP